MKTPVKYALWFFILHTIAEIYTIAWMALQIGGDYGEIQLGIFARMTRVVDWWMRPLMAIDPIGEFLNEHVFDAVVHIWPTSNELAGIITLVLIPVGGAIYATIGWALARGIQFVQQRRR